MASQLNVCVMTQEVKDRMKEFRLRKEKNVAAIAMKIHKASMTIVIDEEFEDIQSIDDLQEELPDQQPRYLALSYVHKHSDGRVSYPLFFIFISPDGCSPEQHMMYAASKLKAVEDGDFKKVIELRALDDLTEDTVLSKLK